MKKTFENIISFWKIILKESKTFVILLFLDILFEAAAPFPGILLSKRIFDMLSKRGSIQDFVSVVILFVVLTLVLNYLNAFFDGMVEIKGQKMMFDLSISYNLKSTSISYEKLSHPATLEMRELAGKAVSGSNFIDMIRYVRGITSNLLILAGVVTLFVKVNFYIMLVVIAVVLINAGASALIKKVQYESTVKVTPYRRKIEYIQRITSDLDYGKEIRLNSFRPVLISKIKALNTVTFLFMKKMLGAQSRGIKIGHITNGIQDFVVYLILGYKVIVEKTLSVGDFSMYFTGINQFKTSLVAIINSLAEIKINSLYMGHFLAYMELPDEDQHVGRTLNEEIDCIRFENVSFKYPGQNTYALKNVSFTLHKNEKLSIVGLNGSGKTTIVKLLVRLYTPTEGQITINNTNISDLSHEDYVKYFSVVFQDYKLFAFSIRENLCNNETVSDEKLGHIFDELGLLDKINSLPEKYDTNYSRMFDESGVEFSGGQAQKIAIARALYKNSSVIILDEPTSALDPVAEYGIYRDFDLLVKGKTAIYISHRLSSCRFCDHILLLNNGQIQEYGTHEELMKLDHQYADMYKKQAQFYVDVKSGDNNE